MNAYDLVVIGTGPGGYPAAIRASKLGLKVAAIENENVGGTCLNVGCIPSKTMLHFSELYAQTVDYRALFGLEANQARFDFTALSQHKIKVVVDLRASVLHLFQKNKIDLIQGEAKLSSPHSVTVNGKEINAKNILLATGSVPIELPFLPFDEKRILSSTGALALDHIPRSMVVIGAGVIGVELASVFSRLGTQVKVVELLPDICAGIDQDLSKGLLSALKKEGSGIEFFLSTKVINSKEGSEGITLQLTNEKTGNFELASEVVLVAVGRRAHSKHLGLESVGITPLKNGCITVDASFRTQIASIYAIGDLIEGPMLAHRATEEGIVAAELVAGKTAEIDYMCLPNIIYTFPECATVGLTENEVKQAGREYKKATAYLRGNPRAIASGFKEGFVKVIADSKTDRLLGLHILSPAASEMIAMGMVAINQKMTVTALGDLPFAHPTLSEAIKEACLQISGKVIHL